MSRNDITGDDLVSKPVTERYRKGWDAIFNAPQYKCIFCGKPSRIPPEDQEAPADYCQPDDHE